MVLKLLILFFGWVIFINGKSFNDEVAQGTFIFKQALKKENTVLLEFSSNKKLYYFDAAKSELKPYIFYTTDASGGIVTNEKVRNLKFILRYSKWPSNPAIVYIISVKEY